MITLASASARRAELLSAAGFEYEIAAANVDETPKDGEVPTDYVLRVARAKADRVAMDQPSGRVVIAADTVVVAGGRMMGKPVDRRDAELMLRALSGAVHLVHTAVVVQVRSRQVSEVVTTRVRVLELSEEEIAWYLATGEPDGKAGAYGIQGRAARFIDWIDGSWSNVVGLPISTVYRLLKEVGEPD